MTPTLNALGMTAATLLMLLAGIAKSRFEWKPRDRVLHLRPRRGRAIARHRHPRG